MTLLAVELSDPTRNCIRPIPGQEANRKCSPSGRNQGKPCAVPMATSIATARLVLPPSEEIFIIGAKVVGAKTMMPFGLQDPPTPLMASASGIGGPPRVSSFLSFRLAKKPTQRLSGDQKGNAPPSVPGSGCALAVSSARSHNWLLPSSPAAANTIRLPSGDNATGPELFAKWNEAFSGGSIVV